MQRTCRRLGVEGQPGVNGILYLTGAREFRCLAQVRRRTGGVRGIEGKELVAGGLRMVWTSTLE